MTDQCFATNSHRLCNKSTKLHVSFNPDLRRTHCKLWHRTIGELLNGALWKSFDPTNAANICHLRTKNLLRHFLHCFVSPGQICVIKWPVGWEPVRCGCWWFVSSSCTFKPCVGMLPCWADRDYSVGVLSWCQSIPAVLRSHLTVFITGCS